jgi:hypothetical protein
MMMEALSTSETLVNLCQFTWQYNPEDSHLHKIYSVISKYIPQNVYKTSGQMCHMK